jgi:uncharacterized protein YyaL (SSP411 family)
VVNEDVPVNHLEGQTSPYLLQHAHNPVDWHPWTPETLSKAKKLDRPIFLSIGYAACHWCHVMERESFEDEAIAEFLNEHFVCIKVDREERPDLDEIYMSAVQLLTGTGGWPLSVFLMPSLEPFVGGTYFPPRDMHGRPGFLSLLRKIEEAWRTRRNEIERAGADLTRGLETIATGGKPDEAEGIVGRPEQARAVAELSRRFDGRWGGFGPAPKFPPHGAVALLLREHHRTGETVPLQMAALTLDRMATGGMYDQLGGGFARYSVDERWLVPHFEKMLYDQALLVPVYVDAWLLTRRPLYRRVVEETLDFVRREMTGAEGGLYSSIDADSEGVEGKFYIWSPGEVREVLGNEDGAELCQAYGISDDGNFEGKSIPNLLHGTLEQQAKPAGIDEAALAARLAPLRQRLLAARDRRVRPGTDDKILAAWNGLMITALCRAHQALGRDEDLDSATRAAEFVLGNLRDGGRLRASWRDGQAPLNAYLDDHAFLARGLLDLYESSFARRWLDAAAEIAGDLVERFEDPERGGFFFTSVDHETLLVRTRSIHDGALPAGSGVATETLLRLAGHLDDARLRDAALRTLRVLRSGVEQAPSAFASLLVASELASAPPLQIAIVAERRDAGVDALLAEVRRRYLPNRIIELATGADDREGLPLLSERRPLEGKATAFVCRDYTCDAPTCSPDALGAALDR